MTAFKAMTWNVENLFSPKPDAEEEAKQRYRSKLELLADVIDRLDPDVLALQEVGGEDGEKPLLYFLPSTDLRVPKGAAEIDVGRLGLAGCAGEEAFLHLC